MVKKKGNLTKNKTRAEKFNLPGTINDSASSSSSKSGLKQSNLAEKYGLPSNVYGGSCIPPVGGQPNYYKLAEDAENKLQFKLKMESLKGAPGAETRQLAASYWKLLLGPTQFIYWDPNARNDCRNGTKGRWIFIDKARDILEGSSPTTQCNNVIGNFTYLNTPASKVPIWFAANNPRTPGYSYEKLYNVFADPSLWSTRRYRDPDVNQFIAFRSNCCWLCGFPLFKSSPSPCEHILPVVNAIFNLNLYQADDNRIVRMHSNIINNIHFQVDPRLPFPEVIINELNAQQIELFFPQITGNDTSTAEERKQEYIKGIPKLRQLLLEYAWSHTCCNKLKDDYNLLTTRDNRLIPNERMIIFLLQEIQDKCFKEIISALNNEYKFILTTPSNSDWLKARTASMYSHFLQPICDYANEIYSPAPILYSIAAIAGIVSAVPTELRNLLLFSSVSESRLNSRDLQEYASKLDITSVKYKPDYKENASVVYIAANKIAAFIGTNAITLLPGSRAQSARTSMVSITNPTAAEYCSLLNVIFPVTFSGRFKEGLRTNREPIVNGEMLAYIGPNKFDQKTETPYFTNLIAGSLLSDFPYSEEQPPVEIKMQIYNFYKFLFCYLVMRTFPYVEAFSLATCAYYILQYQIIQYRIHILGLQIVTQHPNLKQFLDKMNKICNSFITNHIKNAKGILNSLENTPAIIDIYLFYINLLWPPEIPKPEGFDTIGRVSESYPIEKPEQLLALFNSIANSIRPTTNAISPDESTLSMAKSIEDSSSTFSTDSINMEDSSDSGMQYLYTAAQDLMEHDFKEEQKDPLSPLDILAETASQETASQENPLEVSEQINSQETIKFSSNLDLLVDLLNDIEEVPITLPVSNLPVSNAFQIKSQEQRIRKIKRECISEKRRSLNYTSPICIKMFGRHGGKNIRKTLKKRHKKTKKHHKKYNKYNNKTKKQ